ncbi:SMI1/KNR4 family protein [Streptomyces sp. NPDC018833]|uniref:SMI1/KNR4 family protein n=1 Tax=Streptomyces sp. NPDC018833 TaxID=3365053 RepID=UPI0037B624CA
MTHEFDLGRSLAAGVEDRQAVWDFVRGFAEHWSDTALGDDDGLPEAELVAAEQRLGLRLPAALREAYALLGRRDDLTSNHDTLREPAELCVDETGEALVFRDENQGAARWGILLADLSLDDPPVRIRPDLADKSREKWEPWLERTSLAFLEIVLSEATQAPDELVDFLDAPDEGIVAALEKDGVRLAFSACPPGEPSLRWFLYHGVLVRDTGGEWLHIRGRTEEAVESVRNSLDGDWLNG